MSYQHVESNSHSGGDISIDFYLYPNAGFDDVLVEQDSLVREATRQFGDQIIQNDVIHQYDVYLSFEHPQFEPKDDAKETLSDSWDTYDGPNNKQDTTGCHLLIYQSATARTNGASERIEPPFGGGASEFPTSCVFVWGPRTVSYAGSKNIAMHELGHTLIIDDDGTFSSPTNGLGDSDKSDFVDHELGNVYPGIFGDGPTSPMSTGYERSERKEGMCSNDAFFNQTYDASLTACTKEAIKRTVNR